MNKSIERIHFLHIRKTGGTAVKHALSQTAMPHELVLHPHATRLMDIPLGEPVFFFLRDPVSRFVSGFNSRLREGRPRYHYPWTVAEREAFTRFPTPESLVLALASPSTDDRTGADDAMRAIRHVSSSFGDWLGDEAYLRSRRDDLFLIGRQERLALDFDELKGRLGLPSDLRLPDDAVEAHRTPPGVDTTLSEASIQVLRERYRNDYRLLQVCAELTGPDRH